jgi:hypothetical protein
MPICASKLPVTGGVLEDVSAASLWRDLKDLGGNCGPRECVNAAYRVADGRRGRYPIDVLLLALIWRKVAVSLWCQIRLWQESP